MKRWIIVLSVIMTCIGVLDCRQGVVAEEIESVASFNGVEYTSIQEAVDAVAISSTESENVITLLKSCELSSEIQIPAGVNIILDMNNYEISNSYNNLFEYCSTVLVNNGDLIIKNGSFSINQSDMTSEYADYKKTIYIIENIVGAKLMLENVSFTETFKVTNNWPKAKTVGAFVTCYTIYNEGILDYDSGTIKMDTKANAWFSQSAHSIGIYNSGQAEIRNIEMSISSQASKITTTTISSTSGQSSSKAIVNDAIMSIDSCYIENINVTNSYSSQSFEGNIYNQSIAIENNAEAGIEISDTYIKSTSNATYNSSQDVVCIGLKNLGNAEFTDGELITTSNYCSEQSINCGIYNEGSILVGKTGPVEINTVSRQKSYGLSNYGGIIEYLSGKIVAETLMSDDAYGIFNQNYGSITIGKDDGNVELDLVSIMGVTAGINLFEEGTLYYYDGMMNGSIASISNVICPSHYEIVEEEDIVFLELVKKNLYFNANGGVNRINSVKVPYSHYIAGYLINDPDEIPTREHYKFVQWTLDQEGEDVIILETVLEDDIEVYAQWEPNQYVAKFFNYDATLIGEQQSKYMTAIISPSDLTRKGFNLRGWNTKQDGTGIEYAVGEEIFLESDLSLYAQWELNHAHDFIWKIDQEATENSTGIKHEECSVCSLKRNENTVIPKVNSEIENHREGTILTDTKNECVAVVDSSDVNNPTVIYIKPTNGKATIIKVPDTLNINGIIYKVTDIADNAFKNNNTVTKIIIGDNVKTIGKNAFSGCKKLKIVTIGKNVTTIGSKAFYNCKGLNKITIPSKVNKIDSYAFKNCKKLSSVTIGKAVKTIGKEAFRGCSKLKSLNIKSKKLKTVGKNAFKGIKSSAKIKVPSSNLKSYKNLLKSKGQSKKVKITK